MINIAICDDETQELERANSFLRKYMQENPQYQISIFLFSVPLELLSYIEDKGGFDIYLLDIYMDGMLGIEVARELRHLGEIGEIIFLTTTRDYAIEAFEVDAAQYLVKPYLEKSIFLALDKVLSRIKVERRHIITFKTTEGIVRVQTRYIVFTETGRNNYQIIHTIQGQKLEVRMTTIELFELLSQTKFFVKCGASLNLNLKYIRQIKKNMIVLDSGVQLSYPYRSYQKLKEEFLSFQMSINN